MAKKKVEKQSFIMHRSFRTSLSKLNSDEYREVMEAIFDYTETRERPIFKDRLLDIIFDSIQEKLDEDYESWIKTCEKNKQKAELRWQRQHAKECTSMPQYASANIGTKNDAENADYDNDYDNELYSVCNTYTRAREENQNICHLESDYKQESCFECMKKKKCLLKESPQFLLKHPEGFNSWNEEREKLYEEWSKKQKARGQPIDIRLFDYNWLDGESE